MALADAPTSIYDVVARYREQMATATDGTISAVRLSTRHIWEQAEANLEQLDAVIATAQDEGRDITRNWLYQQQRYRLLVEQLEADYALLSQRLADGVGVSQRTAIDAAGGLVRDALAGSTRPGLTSSFATLNTEVVTQAVLLTMPGPVRDVLERYGSAAAKAAQEALVDGIALGRAPRLIARDLRSTLGVNAIRAETIARTETMRAFREASRVQMMANQDILEGWVWESARNTKTCAVCWGMQGTFFPFTGTGRARPEWKPTMSPEEASAWTKGSATHGEVWHHFTDLKAAQGIMSGGFDNEAGMGGGGILGKGTYLTADPEGEGINRMWSTERLDVAIRADKVVEFEEGNFSAMSKWMAENAVPGEEDPSQTAKRLGIDAFRILKPKESAAPWMLVVDPKRVTVVDRSAKPPAKPGTPPPHIPLEAMSAEEAHAKGISPMYTHPNCRCVLMPRAKSYGEIIGDPSLPDTRPPIVRGEDAFAKLSADRQRAALGPGRYALYQKGMPLSQMLRARPDPVWGLTRGMAPMRLLKPARALHPEVVWAKDPVLSSLQRDAIRIRDAFEEVSGVTVRWDGKIRWGGKGETAEALVDKGVLSVGRGLPDGQDRYQTLLHEMAHFGSPGGIRSIPPYRYGPRPGDVTISPDSWASDLGEGTAEGAMRFWREPIYRRVYGDPAAARSVWRSRDLEHPYRFVTDAIDDVRRLIPMDQDRYWRTLIDTAAEDRAGLFAQWAKDNPNIQEALFGADPSDPYIRHILGL